MFLRWHVPKQIARKKLLFLKLFYKCVFSLCFFFIFLAIGCFLCKKLFLVLYSISFFGGGGGFVIIGYGVSFLVVHPLPIYCAHL